MKELREIETKYAADSLDFKGFSTAIKKYGAPLSFAASLSYNPHKMLVVESPDYYFDKEYKKDKTTLRYRRDKDNAEFTYKKKLSEFNNFVRHETNLKLRNSDSLIDDLIAAHSFASGLGFKFAFSIYKKCYIYHFDGYNIVYYQVYNSNQLFLNSFVEIEVDDTNETSENLFKKLENIEADLNQALPAVVMKSKRINESLYELYCGKL